MPSFAAAKRYLVEHRQPERPIDKYREGLAQYIRAHLEEGVTLLDLGTSDEELDRLTAERRLFIVKQAWLDYPIASSEYGDIGPRERALLADIIDFLMEGHEPEEFGATPAEVYVAFATYFRKTR